MRKQRMQRQRIVYAALAAVSIAIVTQLLQLGGDLDCSELLKGSLVCFSIAIPALAAAVYVVTIEIEHDQDPRWGYRGEYQGRVLRWPWTVPMMLFVAVGIVASYLGLTLLLAYFGVVPVTAFLLVSVGAYLTARRHEKRRNDESSGDNGASPDGHM